MIEWIKRRIQSNPIQKKTIRIFGDAMSDAARLAAMNARATLENRYNTDKLYFDNGDKPTYAEQNDTWNRIKGVMHDTNINDYNDCFTKITTEYNLLKDEHDYLHNAWAATGAGDNDVDQGDVLPANQSMQKIQKYQAALQCYASATNYCQSAETKHNSCMSAASAVQTAEDKYG